MKFTKNLNSIVRSANTLSLGISIVVAIGLGVLCGYYLRKWTGLEFLFWLFLIFGVCAALLNVYKAYKMLMREAENIENDPKYANLKQTDDEEDD